MINKLKKKIFDIINSLSWLKIIKKIIAINIKKNLLEMALKSALLETKAIAKMQCIKIYDINIFF